MRRALNACCHPRLANESDNRNACTQGGLEAIPEFDTDSAAIQTAIDAALSFASFHKVTFPSAAVKWSQQG